MRKAHGRSGFKKIRTAQRLQYDVSQTVPERLLVAVNDPPLVIDRQALGGDGRSGDVAAQQGTDRIAQPSLLVSRVLWHPGRQVIDPLAFVDVKGLHIGVDDHMP